MSDLTWPGYRKLLESERALSRVGVSTVSVRRLLVQSGARHRDIVDRFLHDYEAMGCDGLRYVRCRKGDGRGLAPR